MKYRENFWGLTNLKCFRLLLSQKVSGPTRRGELAVMESYIRQRCLEILGEIESHPISCMFAEPVDPERDESPGYFDVVKRPMDLTTVRQKLENNEYPTVHDWKEEVLLTFANAITYNGKHTPIGVMAADLKAIFKDLVKTIADDQNSTWINELVQLRKELCDQVASRSAAMFGHTHSHVVASVQKRSQVPVDATAEVRRLVVNCMTKP
jgi:hypothetical protein